MVRDVFKFINESTSVEFETALNEAGAAGFKIVPLTVSYAPGAFRCVMGKSEDPERGELKARAAAAGLHTVEPYGV